MDSPRSALARLWHNRTLRTIVVVAFIGLVSYFLYQYARDIEWHRVWLALLAIPPTTIAEASAVTAGGYLAYAALDLLSQRYTGHKLPRTAVTGIAMLSYALNLNLGVLIGGLGTRLRLYSRMGCDKEVPASVTLFSGLSNWIGFCWLGGILFLTVSVPLPPAAAEGASALRIAGGVLLLAAAGYSVICLRHAGSSRMLSGILFKLPTFRMALAQGAVAALSWALMGLTLHLLLQGRVPYVAVLGILLYSGVAALVTRIPGGLGTTEALFVAALAGQVPPFETLGAVLAYRAVYFVMPLMLSLVAFAATEAGLAWRHHRAASR